MKIYHKPYWRDTSSTVEIYILANSTNFLLRAGSGAPAIIGAALREFLPTGPNSLGLVICDAEFNRLFHIKFWQKKVQIFWQGLFCILKVDNAFFVIFIISVFLLLKKFLVEYYLTWLCISHKQCNQLLTVTLSNCLMMGIRLTSFQSYEL